MNSAWYCYKCARPCVPDLAHPSIDPRFMLATCACSDAKDAVRKPVTATRDQAAAERLIAARNGERTYLQALRKQGDGRELSNAESSALAARRS